MAPDELLHQILVRFAGALGVPVEQVRPDIDFFRAGGGSLRGLLLLRDLERDVGLRVPPERFWLGVSPLDLAGELSPAVSGPGVSGAAGEDR